MSWAVPVSPALGTAMIGASKHGIYQGRTPGQEDGGVGGGSGAEFPTGS